MTEATASAGAAGSADTTGGAAGSTGGGAAAQSSGGAPDFFASLSPDLQSHPAITAYRKDNAFDVAGLVKEHVNLQGLIGKKGIIPPGEKDAPEAWDRFYTALGRPEKPDGYEFQKPQGFDGYSDEFAGAYRAAAHANGLTAKQAAAMHDWFVKSTIDAEQAKGAQAAESGKALDTELRTKWGAAYDAKVAAGKRAAKAFAPADVLDKLEASIGSPALMEMFANIGEKMGEDGLVGTGSGGVTLTPQQAQAEIAKMDAQMNDPKGPAMDKFHPEHEAWIRRREQLFAQAYP